VIPVIDLAAGTPATQAAAIDAALREHGFYAVVNHGVPAALVNAAFDAGHRFFALEEAVKRQWHVDHWPLKRGFDPIGWQALDPSMPPDVKESFYLGVETVGPNQWPDEALLPGFRTACNAYSAAVQGLALRLMGLYEIALGLPTGFFDGFMQDQRPLAFDAAPGDQQDQRQGSLVHRLLLRPRRRRQHHAAGRLRQRCEPGALWPHHRG